MTQNGKVIQYWILLFLSSCSPSCLSDLQCEGEAQTRKLAQELQQIQTKEDLQRSLPKIKKRFNQLADLLVTVKKFPKKKKEPTFASEQLFVELARIYEMPGGKELIESSQEQAIQKLKDL